MTPNVKEMDSVSSTTFIKKPPCLNDKQESLLYTKEVLSSRLFLGFYKERRWVSALNEYRDVILVSSGETDLHFALDKVRKKWMGVLGIKWVGITGPDVIGTPNAYCFWVKISNLAFGHYWFQIKHVKLIEEEVIIHLKCIRKFIEAESAVITKGSEKLKIKEKERPATPQTTTVPSIVEENQKLQINETIIEAVEFIQPYLSWKKIFTAIKLVCALVIILIVGLVSCVKSVGEYLLKLIRELSILVTAFTPIALHLIDFISKIVGGMFILLAGIINPRRGPQQYRNHFHSVPFKTPVPSQNLPVNWRERNRMLRQELFSNQKPKNDQ